MFCITFRSLEAAHRHDKLSCTFCLVMCLTLAAVDRWFDELTLSSTLQWICNVYTLYVEAAGHTGIRVVWPATTVYYPLKFFGVEHIIEDQLRIGVPACFPWSYPADSPVLSDLHHRNGWRKSFKLSHTLVRKGTSPGPAHGSPLYLSRTFPVQTDCPRYSDKHFRIVFS